MELRRGIVNVQRITTFRVTGRMTVPFTPELEQMEIDLSVSNLCQKLMAVIQTGVNGQIVHSLVETGSGLDRGHVQILLLLLVVYHALTVDLGMHPKQTPVTTALVL